MYESEYWAMDRDKQQTSCLGEVVRQAASVVMTFGLCKIVFAD